MFWRFDVELSERLEGSGTRANGVLIGLLARADPQLVKDLKYGNGYRPWSVSPLGSTRWTVATVDDRVAMIIERQFIGGEIEGVMIKSLKMKALTLEQLSVGLDRRTARFELESPLVVRVVQRGKGFCVSIPSFVEFYRSLLGRWNAVCAPRVGVELSAEGLLDESLGFISDFCRLRRWNHSVEEQRVTGLVGEIEYAFIGENEQALRGFNLLSNAFEFIGCGWKTSYGCGRGRRIR